MSSKLFHSVIASSVLLLSGCASHASPDGDVEVDSSNTDAARDDVSATDASIADVLADARSGEAGWPTTKGVMCTTPAVGDAYCCREVGEMHQCYLESYPSVACVVDASGQCVPSDASSP